MVRPPCLQHEGSKHGEHCEQTTAVASLTIRNLDDATKARLRLQAVGHGRSMEEEARTILREAVSSGTSTTATRGLGCRIQAHFAHLGSVELELPERTAYSPVALLIHKAKSRSCRSLRVCHQGIRKPAARSS